MKKIQDLNAATPVRAQVFRQLEQAILDAPKGALVVLVRRGDDYQVPNGQLVLENGDVLLLLQREEINT